MKRFDGVEIDVLEAKKFRNLVDSHRWIFAKTYAAFCPHEYTLIREWSNKEDFYWFAKFIWDNGFFARYEKNVSKYYIDEKYPCLIVEGHNGLGFINYAIHGMDELKSIDNICKNEKGCICDFFNGQGSVSLSDYKHNLDFVCSELNPNRLGKALHRLENAGAKIKLE